MKETIKNITNAFANNLKRRAIGIDIRKDRFCAVEMIAIGDSYRTEKVFCTPIRRKDDDLTQLLNEMFKTHHFSRWASISIAVDSEKVYYRRCSEQLDGKAFPIDNSELLCVQLESISNDDSLKIATSDSAIAEKVNILKQAGQRPTTVTAPLLGIFRAAAYHQSDIEKGKSALAYITAQTVHIAILNNGKILSVRKIPLFEKTNQINSILSILLTETQAAWEKPSAATLDEDKKIYIINEGLNDENLRQEINEKYPESFDIIDLNEKWPHNQNNGQLVLAKALAFSVLKNECPEADWLTLFNNRCAQSLDIRKELKIIVSLAAAIAIVSFVAIFMNMTKLQRQNDQLDGQIAETFNQALPDERMVRPLHQLDHHLQGLRTTAKSLNLNYGDSSDFMELFYSIIKTIPPQSEIRIRDLIFDQNSLSVQAQAQTFKSIQDWQQLLGENILQAKIKTSDINRQDSTGLISFTLSIKISRVDSYASINP